jgi:mannose-6-phosphate isomerase-like protein (cupin superfamily)
MNINGYSYRIKASKENLRTKPFYHYENGQTSTFDVPAIIEDLKKQQNWLNGEISSVILLSSPTIKVLLTLMHEGTEVISYQADDSVTFQVIDGSMILHIGDESILIREGEMLTLDEKLKYSFDAVEETAFLLTLVSGKENKNE